MKHFIIPDTQVKPGVETSHLTAAMNYVCDKQPEKIIHLGDHWDMHSLSSYDKGTKRAEGTRYHEDIRAGNDAMDVLMEPLLQLQSRQRRNKKTVYDPERYFLIGNHEQRIERYVNENAELWGHLGYRDFNLDRHGWVEVPFTEPVVLDGVSYAHYFYNPNTGNAYGGMLPTRLKNIGFSFTMGHQQGKDTAQRYLSNGHVHRALVVGSFYQHEEHYKGPQGNEHWQGCIMCHEVRDGNYDIMELSMNYLLEKWL